MSKGQKKAKGTGKRLTKETKTALIEDLQNRAISGVSVTSIAKKHGVAQSTAEYYATKNKKKKPGPKTGKKPKKFLEMGMKKARKEIKKSIKKEINKKILMGTSALGNVLDIPITEDVNSPKNAYYGLKKSDLDIKPGNIVEIEIPLKEKLRQTIREIVLEEIEKLF